jgi:hypothetical protein
LKKYAKRKILLDELCASRNVSFSSTPSIPGANVRANVAQYEHEYEQMLAIKHHASCSTSINLMEEENLPSPHSEKEENVFPSFIPESRLDQDQFIESLLINASKDYEQYKTKTSKAIEVIFCFK